MFKYIVFNNIDISVRVFFSTCIYIVDFYIKNSSISVLFKWMNLNNFIIIIYFNVIQEFLCHSS